MEQTPAQTPLGVCCRFPCTALLGLIPAAAYARLNVLHFFCPPPHYHPSLAPLSPLQTSPRTPGRTFVFPASPSSPRPTQRARSPSPRSPELLGVIVGQRVRRLSSPSGEEQEGGGGGAGQEERGGETEGEKREERRRQAQLLQIHRELQNVEVIVRFVSLICPSVC